MGGREGRLSNGPFTSVFRSIFLTSDFFQKRAEGSKVWGGGKGV